MLNIIQFEKNYHKLESIQHLISVPSGMKFHFSSIYHPLTL